MTGGKMVKVYRFRACDPTTSEMKVAPRAATLDAIGRIETAKIIEGTEHEVPASALDGNDFVRADWKP